LGIEATAGSLSQWTAFSTTNFGTALGLAKLGAGDLVLDQANDYTGATTVRAGKLILADNSAAGTSAGGIAVSGTSAATLQINSGITTADDIVFSNTNAASSVKRNVAASGTYTTGTSGALKSSFSGGTPDTTAQILSGASSSLTESTLTMSFAGSSGATNDLIRRSDVFTTSGTGSDLYVLQLTASGQDSTSVLAYNNGSIWDLAVTGNTGTNNATTAQQNFAGSFADFQTLFGTTLGAYQGAYGLDVSTNSLWAVVNYGGSFAAVPEPTGALAGLLLGSGLLRRRRNSGR
jgi:autotransporter-associated beta strand protein